MNYFIHPSRCVLRAMLLASAVASAQSDRASLAVLPLDVDEHPTLMRTNTESKKAFFRAVDAESGAAVLSRTETLAAESKATQKDFRSSDAALAEVATKAKAIYAMFAALELAPDGTLVLSGRIVRDDGKAIASGVAKAAVNNTAMPIQVASLTRTLLQRLDTAHLPSVRAVEQPVREVAKVPLAELRPLPTVEAPPPAARSAQNASGRPQVFRVLGPVGVGVGGAAIVAGAVLFATAPKSLAGGTPAYGTTDNRGAKTQQAIGIGLLAGGGAVAAAGAILCILAPPKMPVLSAGPIPGGAMVTLSGRFP